MAKNEEYFDEGETSDEISISYRMIKAPPVDDENEEGIIEYLDLDFDTSNINDNVEYYSQVAPSAATKSTFQSSLLKVENAAQKSKIVSRSKTARKRSTARSSVGNTNTGGAPSSHRQHVQLDSTGTARVQAAVTAINARLAESTKSMNGHVDAGLRKDSLKTTQKDKPKSKSGLDGLDLFFQSMAQTVMTLPPRVQAKIKMDICKVIANAEMKYSTSDKQEIFRN